MTLVPEDGLLVGSQSGPRLINRDSAEAGYKQPATMAVGYPATKLGGFQGQVGVACIYQCLHILNSAPAAREVEDCALWLWVVPAPLPSAPPKHPLHRALSAP